MVAITTITSIGMAVVMVTDMTMSPGISRVRTCRITSPSVGPSRSDVACN
jgi:hypothetical protein